jgi:hypothetical protein
MGALGGAVNVQYGTVRDKYNSKVTVGAAQSWRQDKPFKWGVGAGTAFRIRGAGSERKTAHDAVSKQRPCCKEGG